MTLVVTHSKTLIAPDSGTEDKVYGSDYVSPSSHTISGGDSLANVTGTDADTTMATNTAYVVDMTAWATADRSYTLPTTATVGDRIAVSALVGNASFELILKTGAGQTCAFAGSAVAAATEITRLFITGEAMVFRYAATNKWVVERDDRIPQTALFRLSTNAATETASTWTNPTDKSGVWTLDQHTGGFAATSTGRATFRRAGKVSAHVSAWPAVAVTAGQNYGARVAKNGNGVSPMLVVPGGTTVDVSVGSPVFDLPVAVDDYLQMQFFSSQGSRGLLANASQYLSAFGVTEVLP